MPTCLTKTPEILAGTEIPDGGGKGTGPIVTLSSPECGIKKDLYVLRTVCVRVRMSVCVRACVRVRVRACVRACVCVQILFLL